MASLTATLDTETRGKQIIEGKKAGPSFLKGLLDFGTDYVAGAGQRQARSDQRAEDALKAKIATGLDEAEQVRFDSLNGANTALQKQLEEGGKDLTKAKAAADQGRLPYGSLDLKVEAKVSELYAAHPESRAEIAAYYKAQGFDHYLFREVEYQRAFEDNAQAAQVAGTKTAIDRAVAGGVSTGNMEVDIETGQRLLRADEQLALAMKDADVAAKKAAALGVKANDTAAGKAAQDNLLNGVAGQASARMGPLSGQLIALVGSADTPDRVANLAKVGPLIEVGFEKFYQDAEKVLREKGADIESYGKLRKMVDDQKTAFKNIFNNTYESNQRAWATMQTNWKLDAAQSMMAYSKIVTVLGQGTANQIMQGDPSTYLPGDVIKAVQDEFRGYKGNTAEGDVRLNNIAQMLKGNLQLKDLNSEEAKAEMLKPMVAATMGNGKMIRDGHSTPEVVSSFMNGYSQTLNAAVEIQPGEPDQTSITRAVGVVAGNRMFQTFQKLATDPIAADNFDSVVFASRSTAAHLLRVQQVSGSKLKTSDGLHSIVWNGKAGLYEIATDKKILEKTSKDGGTIAVEGMIVGSNASQAIPKAMSDKVNNMNTLINHLVGTAQWDKELMKTKATPLQMRNFYHNQTPLPAQKEGGKPVANWDKAYDNFVTDLQTLTVTPTPETQPGASSFKGASISPGDAVSRLSGRGVPDHIAKGIVGNLVAESGLRTGAVGDSGSAFSLAQWRGDRLTHAKENGFDLGDPQDAVDFVLWELNNTEGAAKKKLMDAKTTQEAVDAFALYFLRPQGSPSGDANQVHNISGRRKAALDLG